MKVILVANIGFTISNFRSELIQRFLDRGDTVKVVCSYEEDFNNALKDLGVEIIQIKLDRKGMNPFNDAKTCFDLMKIFYKEKPDLVLNYTIKPVIFSSIAARIASRAKIASFITGLGYVFIGDTKKRKLLKAFVSLSYKIALSLNSKIIFQNNDDLNLFLNWKMVKRDKTCIINGSGVNLEKFIPDPTITKLPSSFAFVGRLLIDKGIGELIKAIREVKITHPNVQLFLCGEPDNNPASFNQDDVDSWVKEGLITHISFTDNVKDFLSDKEVFVLPSYREGTPRSTLEALAMGMPVITTDAPGCKETVLNNVNGYIVPVKDSSELAKKILHVLNNKEVLATFGNESLRLAKEKYDVKKVNEVIFNGLELS